MISEVLATVLFSVAVWDSVVSDPDLLVVGYRFLISRTIPVAFAVQEMVGFVPPP